MWSTDGGGINSTGLYTPDLIGTYTVTAADGGFSGNASVTVTAGALASIVVDPPSATITADETQQYIATGYDAKGNIVPIVPTWSTDGGSASSSGLYTPSQTGTYTVFANASGISGNATVVVTSGVLARLVVTPPAATITADETQQYTAQGFDQHDNPVAVSPSWSVSGGSINLTGLYTPTLVGTFTVTATDGGLSGNATITVTAGALATIVITPSDPTITADETVQFTAAGFDAKGNPVGVVPVWATAGGAIDASGLYSGGPIGTFTVTATDGLVFGTTTVTVTAGAPASLDVTPETAELRVGENRTFTAVVRDADGNAVAATVTWSVDATGTIGPTGVFVATSAGTGTVTATVAGTSLSDTAQVTVTARAGGTPTVFPWWILVFLVIAAFLLLFFLWRRRRKKDEEAPTPDTGALQRPESVHESTEAVESGTGEPDGSNPGEP
jgi:hypothetical protein